MVFRRDDFLRVEFHGKNLRGDLHCIYCKHGDELRGWSEPDLGLDAISSLDGQIGSIAGGSSFIGHCVPNLLLGRQDPSKHIGPILSKLEQANYIGEEAIGEIQCHRVQGISGMWTVTLWVDVNSSLLRRLDLKTGFMQSSTLFTPIAGSAIPEELLDCRISTERPNPPNEAVTPGAE